MRLGPRARLFRVVFSKEWREVLRDRRTLARMLLPALLVGPLMLVLMSVMIGQFEAQADKREIAAIGIEHAPTLRNFLERQAFTVKPAPTDYERQLRDRRLSEPVLLIGADFEAQLARGEPPVLTLVSDSVNQRAQASLGTLRALLQEFNRERGTLALAMAGLSPELFNVVEVDVRDLASQQARASQFTSFLPMFLIMAVLSGVLTAALDATAGERERGSLEPLLMNPVPPGTLVLGKWAVAALLGVIVTMLSNLSFLPSQVLIQHDGLQAMFRFGWGEALRSVLVVIPLAASMSAVMMAVAIRTRSFKEAQSSTTLVMTFTSLAPMVSLMNPGANHALHYWIPSLGQYELLLLVLKGEPLAWAHILPTLVTSAVLTATGLLLVGRSMRGAVAR